MDGVGWMRSDGCMGLDGWMELDGWMDGGWMSDVLLWMNVALDGCIALDGWGVSFWKEMP